MTELKRVTRLQIVGIHSVFTLLSSASTEGSGGGLGAFSSPSSMAPSLSVPALDLAPPLSSDDFGR